MPLFTLVKNHFLKGRMSKRTGCAYQDEGCEKFRAYPMVQH